MIVGYFYIFFKLFIDKWNKGVKYSYNFKFLKIIKYDNIFWLYIVYGILENRENVFWVM